MIRILSCFQFGRADDLLKFVCLQCIWEVLLPTFLQGLSILSTNEELKDSPIWGQFRWLMDSDIYQGFALANLSAFRVAASEPDIGPEQLHMRTVINSSHQCMLASSNVLSQVDELKTKIDNVSSKLNTLESKLFSVEGNVSSMLASLHAKFDRFLDASRLGRGPEEYVSSESGSGQQQAGQSCTEHPVVLHSEGGNSNFRHYSTPLQQAVHESSVHPLPTRRTQSTAENFHYQDILPTLLPENVPSFLPTLSEIDIVNSNPRRGCQRVVEWGFGKMSIRGSTN
jgi:hypothetical protein